MVVSGKRYIFALREIKNKYNQTLNNVIMRKITSLLAALFCLIGTGALAQDSERLTFGVISDIHFDNGIGEGAMVKVPQALKNHHMLFAEAAEIARKAETGGLLLTHFSTSMETPEDYLPAAREIFERTWAATDGLTVTMRYPEKEENAWISLS